MMKRILLTLFAVLLFAAPAFAGQGAFGFGVTATPAGCTEASSQIASRTGGAGTRSITKSTMYCEKIDAPPTTLTECSSGTLSVGHVHHGDTTQGEARIYIYASTASLPSASATYIGGSSAIDLGTSTGDKSANMDGGSVTATSYWMCIMISATADVTVKSGGISSSLATAYYSDAYPAWYTSPPANLGTGNFNSNASSASRDGYVTIK